MAVIDRFRDRLVSPLDEVGDSRIAPQVEAQHDRVQDCPEHIVKFCAITVADGGAEGDVVAARD